MRSLLLLLLASLIPLLGGVRDEALLAANEAGLIFKSDPAAASLLAEKAYQLLASDDSTLSSDLAACAGLTARAARLAGEQKRARQWFQKTLTHAEGAGSVVIRAELADLLMKSNLLPEARAALGEVPQLQSPSPPLAQWHQTSAKLHLTCGLPEKAQKAIFAALAALPKDDISNQVALAIDAAGIALRLGQPVDKLITNAHAQLLTLDSPEPALLTALTSVAAQAPGVSDAQALELLESLDPETLPGDTRLSYLVTLAEAALRNGNRHLAAESLAPVIVEDALPDDHPLLARALSLHADATNNPDSARRSSEVALRWLANSNDSNILLGLQRTVDSLSPLIKHAPDDLPRAALTAQNYALRKRIGGSVVIPSQQTVLYLIYEKNFQQRYGALILKPAPHWIDLGLAEKIHQRITDTLETAERTLGEVNVGATLPVRLTQLYKSLWAPLVEHLDPSKPINIAPVGMLHAVPWSILRHRGGSYLCEAFAEVRILALTGKIPAMKESKEMTVCGIASKPGVLPGAGAFPFDESLAELVQNLPALPGVTAELSNLQGTSYLDPNREQFLSLLKNHQGTLHLAGHGFVIESDQGSGFRAGLILHGEGIKSILFAKEISSLALTQTNLVVLSACRGGIGQGEVGGNWSSLRRSFIAAGAKEVMAAQWRVRDDHLAQFMTRFHQERLTKPAHQALWHLQKELVKDADEIELASLGAWVIESTTRE